MDICAQSERLVRKEKAQPIEKAALEDMKCRDCRRQTMFARGKGQ